MLAVRDLHVSFHTQAGPVQAVRGVNFEVKKSEIVGLVGESGCGKSATAKSILRLLPDQNQSGEIFLDEVNLCLLKEKEMQKIRGNAVGMIFQDPMTSLNPSMRIGHQIGEGLRWHKHLSRATAEKRVLELLELVGIPHPEIRFKQYPFELSGGMRQRVMIALAIACEPKLLIADEPTTALDVTIQAQILALMKTLTEQLKMSLLLITHDLGVVAEVCQRVLVMYAGKIVESGPVDHIFYHPQHPYTKALLHALPRQGRPLIPIKGAPPDLVHPPRGCSFHPRCRYAMRICEQQSPPFFAASNEQSAACWLHTAEAQSQATLFQEEAP